MISGRVTNENAVTTLRVLSVGAPCVGTVDRTDGLTVGRVATGAQGLDRISGGGRIDCVVCSYDLPDMTGVEFVDRVRALDVGLPLVVHVAPDDDVAIADAIAAGATDVVRSEGIVDATLFRARIRNAVQSHGGSDTAEYDEAISSLRQQALEGVVLETLFDDALSLVTRALGATRCGLFERREREDSLVLRAGVGWDDDAIESTRASSNSLAVAALGADEVYTHEVDGEVRTLAVGLSVGDEPWGALAAVAPDDGAFEKPDTTVLDTVAGVLEPAIARDRRARELKRYETIVETIDEGVYALDFDYRITEASDALCSMLGVDRERLVGTDVRTLIDLSLEEADCFADAEERNGQRIGSCEVELETADGTLPVETHYSVLPEADGGEILGVVRDVSRHRRYEQTLTALNNSTHGLLRTESREEVSERIVATASDVLDLPGVTVYLFDGDTGRLEPASVSDAMTGLVGDLPPLGPGDSSLVWRAFVTGEELRSDDVREIDEVYDPETPFQSGLYVPLGEHGVLVAESTRPAAFDETTVELVDLLAASAEAALNRVERETELRARDRELSEQNARLTGLRQTNDIIRAIDQALVQADTREEIERAVCDGLATADNFAFAWIGTPADDGATLEPRVWAGSERGYLDTVSLSLEEPTEPASRATTTRRPTVVSEVTSGFRTESWRRTALTNDYLSVLAVPLVHGDVLYGTLTVYADEAGAFDEMTRTVLSEAGETIAHAINTVETQRTLLADRVTELELRIDDPDLFLRTLATRLGTPLVVDDIVNESGGASLVFLTVEDVDAEVLPPLADEFVTVERVDVIAERDDGIRCELRLAGPTVTSDLTEYGAITRELTADANGIRAVVELPHDADVREFVESVQATYPNTDLVARRSQVSSVQSERDVRAGVTDRLTDRQYEVVRTAYASGFFEWPRDRTGQEVAASLDISQPTFNKHLRSAERKLFSMLLDD
ncbi:bacterio-opsin activator domain-containing protein [Halomarina pelagica]|uniref:bacterio-opsin activator domain-containing protein n=1 Tax=Halomarina pelagica TaxID=2961599 RepID=UPI0020C4E783|nr:bacterio-opsin activator domain-containing protein [Halomarina sp. BND7]